MRYMHRRQFMKLVSTLSSTIPSWALTPAAFGQQVAPSSSAILCMVFARGGLDQNSWTDPRAGGGYGQYTFDSISSGRKKIFCAPMGKNNAFFDEFQDKMIVINGLYINDTGHDRGWGPKSGMKDNRNYPHICEIYADSFPPNSYRVPWYSASDHESVINKVQPTRIPSHAEFVRQFNPPGNSQPDTAMDIAMKQRAASMTHFSGTGNLPAYENAVKYLELADRVRASGAVAGLGNFYDIDYASGEFAGRKDQGLSEANVALKAAALGLTNCIQLHSHGKGFFDGKYSFDAHDDHADRYNTTALPCLTDFLRFVFKKASDYGIANRLLICLYSEMGRNTINSDNGKDHWAVGGMTFISGGLPGFVGNRVIGATTKDNHSLLVRFSDGATNGSYIGRGSSFKESDDNQGRDFRVLTPGVVMHSLRQYLKVDTTDASKSKPLMDLTGKVLSDTGGLNIFTSNIHTGYPTTMKLPVV